MTAPRTSRLRRPWSLLLLAALAALSAGALPPVAAHAGPAPAPGPAAALQLTLGAGLSLPAGSRAPQRLYSEQQDLSVTVDLVDAAGAKATYASNQPVDVSLAVTASGSAFLQGTTTVTIPGGGTTATFSGLRLRADNLVQLTATVVAPRKAAGALRPGTSPRFDVVLRSSTRLLDAGQRASSLLLTADGSAGVPCTATAATPTCVDVVLPNGVGSDVFFSTGTCTGSIGCRSADRSVLQVLADLETPATGTQQRYPNSAPATLVVKCDKSLCGGGAISRNLLRASLQPTGPLQAAPVCSAKGVVDSGLEHCVDYVQSKRDGSGDTYLYWLVTRDARFSI